MHGNFVCSSVCPSHSFDAPKPLNIMKRFPSYILVVYGTTPGFTPSASLASHVSTHLLSCQLISVIITTLIIHHSFILSLQAQNLPFQQILPTLGASSSTLDCLHDHGTGPDLDLASRFIFSSFFL